MPEGLKTNEDKELETFCREKYENFRKEILAFKDLPESTFSKGRRELSTFA